MKQAKSVTATVAERKLGREKSDGEPIIGLAHFEEGLIEIDPRLTAKTWMAVLVHEALHLAFPEIEEADILRAEKTVAGILWKSGCRRVHLK